MKTDKMAFSPTTYSEMEENYSLSSYGAADDPLMEIPTYKKIDVHCFLRRTNQLCNCEENSFEHIVVKETDYFKNITKIKCNTCNQEAQIDPWWMVNEYTDVNDVKDVEDVNDVNAVEDVKDVEAVKGVNAVNDVKEEIVRFIQCHNPTKTLSCKKDWKGIHRFVPSKQDCFGIVSSVGCIKCHVEMSLEMNTANSHKLTVIEEAKYLNPGDQIMFRRWYGISHHAIYLGKGESKENNGCCSSCSKCYRFKDDFVDVISHTVHEDVDKKKKDVRVTHSSEWLKGGLDVYRVEYDSCYPPKWTEVIARRAQQFAKVCKDQIGKQDSISQEANYHPLMENCEHFARRCKTGQSESRQVKAYFNDCGKYIAMFVLRVAILATWWIAEAAIKDEEETNEDLRTKLTKMEAIAATSLCILFLALKVVFSSIEECRKIRRPQELTTNEEDTKQIAKKTTRGRRSSRDTQKKRGKCGKTCTECRCICCPKSCCDFCYHCKMSCCIVPFGLCNEFNMQYNDCARYSCECKQCCHDPVMKFCCRQYVVIILRVAVSEAIVVGIPIGFLAFFEWYCPYSAFKGNSLNRAASGFAITLFLVLVLSFVHSIISNCFGRCIGWCCHRCCCCCYCCCSFKYSRRRLSAEPRDCIESTRLTDLRIQEKFTCTA